MGPPWIGLALTYQGIGTGPLGAIDPFSPVACKMGYEHIPQMLDQIGIY